MTKLVLMLVCTLACHHEVKEDLAIDQTESDDSVKATEQTRGETKKQDPTDVDTKTTKSDNAVIIQEADGRAAVVRVLPNRPLPLNKGARVIGVVPIAVTTVDQSKHLGAVTTEKTDSKKSTESDDKDKNTKAGLKTEESSDVGFSLKFYLLAGGILAAVVALGIFLSHSKLIRRLLGEPL